MIKYGVKFSTDNGETTGFTDVDAKNYSTAYLSATYKLPKEATIIELFPMAPHPVSAEKESEYSQLSLGETLKQARIAQGWTTIELAEITGISHAEILAYETEKSEPRISHLKWLSEALGLSLFNLIEKV